MRVKRLISTLPDGRTCVNSPGPALIVEFMRYGRAMGNLTYDATVSGWPPLAMPNDVMVFADAEDATLRFIHKDVPAGAINLQIDVGEDLDPAGNVLRWSDGSTLERRWRGCYRRAGATLPRVDMTLARVQRMNEVRGERASKLTKSDVDLLRASMETSDVVMQNTLRIYRQQLRDLPTTEQPNVEALTTPEQLAAWQPAWPPDPVPVKG